MLKHSARAHGFPQFIVALSTCVCANLNSGFFVFAISYFYCAIYSLFCMSFKQSICYPPCYRFWYGHCNPACVVPFILSIYYFYLFLPY